MPVVVYVSFIFVKMLNEFLSIYEFFQHYTKNNFVFSSTIVACMHLVKCGMLVSFNVDDICVYFIY